MRDVVWAKPRPTSFGLKHCPQPHTLETEAPQLQSRERLLSKLEQVRNLMSSKYAKPRKCIPLGYGTETKGYRFYDPNRARVFHSRDVQFKESSQGTKVVQG